MKNKETYLQKLFSDMAKKIWIYFVFFAKFWPFLTKLIIFLKVIIFASFFVSKYPYLISRKYESKMQTRIDFRLFLLWKRYSHHFAGNYLYFSNKNFWALEMHFFALFSALERWNPCVFKRFGGLKMPKFSFFGQFLNVLKWHLDVVNSNKNTCSEF